MTTRSREDLAAIEMLILDVDGVLTDGTIIINGDGSESKSFNVLDGHGIKVWQRAGLKVAFLSGRASGSTSCRAKELEIDYCAQGCLDKLEAFEKILDKFRLSADKIAYIGDDLLDLPVVIQAGFSAAVANAVDEVKQHADYVTSRCGGSGAVREVIEYILKNTGRWQGLIKKYLP